MLTKKIPKLTEVNSVEWKNIVGFYRKKSNMALVDFYKFKSSQNKIYAYFCGTPDQIILKLSFIVQEPLPLFHRP